MSGALLVREMRESDAPRVSQAFVDQGWDTPDRPCDRYWEEQQAGKRVVLVAEHAGTFSGCVTILWQAQDSEFLSAGIPEIRELNVLIKFRCMGVGSALMEEAERTIAERSKVAGIAVGVTADYGAAHAMYAKRGYIPDGRGISQREQSPRHGDQITVDTEPGCHGAGVKLLRGKHR